VKASSTPRPEPADSTPPLAEVFAAERPRLVGLAYRITGSRLDAEDIVQDAWLRAEAVDWDHIENPAAWFNTVVSRLALDDLRSARRRRETYVGPWLPEPVLAVGSGGSGPDDPAAEAELAESLTFGFLRLLEDLAPIERVVFLLADVFDTPYREIAEVVEKSPEACRQIASRARRSVRADRPSRHDRPDTAARVATELFTALSAGDVGQVVSLLADDVVLVSDGGADYRAARRPVVGADKVARFLVNIARRGDNMGLQGRVEIMAASVNGEPGIVMSRGGQLYLASAAHVVEGRVERIYFVTNWDKLAALQVSTPLV
jgi:RNA polymerase sigma-70 factor (ECF subfamily)